MLYSNLLPKSLERTGVKSRAESKKSIFVIYNAGLSTARTVLVDPGRVERGVGKVTGSDSYSDWS
jgi:hypothetical protein